MGKILISRVLTYARKVDGVEKMTKRAVIIAACAGHRF